MGKSRYLRKSVLFFIIVLSVVMLLGGFTPVKAMPSSNKLSAVLEFGDRGNNVRYLQGKLYSYGYLRVNPDGIFGENTLAAQKVFELYNGLPIDGVLDETDLEVLDSPSAEPFRNLYEGQSSIVIQNIQLKLQQLGFLPDDQVYSGVFDSETKAAVTLFQAENGLQTPDGIVGPWTTKCMVSSPVSFHDLSFGMRGTGVYVTQVFLKKYGFLTVDPDGISGNMTKNALIAFQLYNGLNTIGYLDRSTALKLFGNSVVGFSNLRIGASGDLVWQIQEKLQELGFLPTSVAVDGIFGNRTYTAVTLFQIFNGLQTPDGIFGRWSASTMFTSPSSFSTLTVGNRGSAVFVIQKYLKDAGYLNATSDGIFGAKTKSALQMYQSFNDLPITETADQETLQCLFNPGYKTVAPGWKSFQGVTFYLKEDGRLATETVSIDGRLEVFRMNGRWIDTTPMDKKAAGYTSKTDYLVLVNLNDRVTKIYQKNGGNWVPKKVFLCTVGDTSRGWNTVKGDFYVGYSNWGNPYTRGYSFNDEEGHTLYYWVRFCDSFLFHSMLYDLYTYDLSLSGNELGEELSHGCVRLRIENAQWIYNNIPDGTRVIVY